MVEKAYHMLPESLCNLCSLLPGEDKLTVSVIFLMDEQGKHFVIKYSLRIPTPVFFTWVY